MYPNKSKPFKTLSNRRDAKIGLNWSGLTEGDPPPTRHSNEKYGLKRVPSHLPKETRVWP